MPAFNLRTRLLRTRRPHEHARVTNVELFFDLVFAFAVTQLSHLLLHDLTAVGVIRAALLAVAVWWVWIYTAWVTNWLDPERTPIRLFLLVLMLAGLILSTSIPGAFEATGLIFASCYVFMQVGRSAFTLWALGDASPANTRNFQRITSWLLLSGLFWVAGGFAHDGTRLGLWLTALVVELISASVGFWVPRLGRSTTGDWDVEGSHIAERCSQFIIIALGESVLVIGATFGELGWSLTTVSAFLVNFVGSVAMWWVYFDTGAERGSRSIAESADPGRMARFAYTYIHLLIVVGIILEAVADALVLAHPAGRSDPWKVFAILGGPALYICGNALFKRTSAHRLPLSHLVGIVLLAALIPAASSIPWLALAGCATAVLVVVAAWEMISLRQGRAAATDP